MTHVTCRLTAKNRDQLRNPTLGNRVWATFTFYYCYYYFGFFKIIIIIIDCKEKSSHCLCLNTFSDRLLSSQFGYEHHLEEG